MNYLSEDQLHIFLRRKKTVEYWLGFEDEQGYETCKWLAIEEGREEKDRYYVILHHVFNDKEEGLNTVYDFSYVEPDDTYGKILDVFDTPEDALSFTMKEYNTKPNKFMPESYIDDFIN